MINFRFHLVSLIAVFLALGLGILVGSTVVDQVIVDRLDTEIKSVRHDSAQRDAENNKLNNQLSQLDEVLKKTAAYAVDQRLSGIPVAIVADKGIDPGAAKSMLDILRASGAEVPGVLWLDDRWDLSAPSDVRALALATGTTDTTRAAAALRIDALNALARRLAEPPPNARKRKTDALTELRSSGFVTLSDGSKAALDDFPARAARVLVLTGTDSKLTASATTMGLVHALVGANIPTVVGDVYDDHNGASPVPERGASVQAVRSDTTAAKEVSTVDDAEVLAGRVAAVIALEQVADGTVGHYGYGHGASSPLPAIAS